MLAPEPDGGQFDAVDQLDQELAIDRLRNQEHPLDGHRLAQHRDVGDVALGRNLAAIDRPLQQNAVSRCPRL